MPIAKFVDYPLSNLILYMIALGTTVFLGVVVTLGVLEDSSDGEGTRGRALELVNSLMGWLTMFNWWYPLDTT